MLVSPPFSAFSLYSHLPSLYLSLYKELPTYHVTYPPDRSPIYPRPPLGVYCVPVFHAAVARRNR